MDKFRSKKLLQFCVAVGGIVPVAAGTAGILFGPGMLDPAYGGGIDLDSHYRYLSGLLLGIGCIFWRQIPDIEKNGGIIRLLTAIVAIGGLGRLWAALDQGLPGPPMLAALGMELIVTPLLALWQYRLAQAFAHSSD